MPKRLAITVAGAVSLGSFEAGVLYEIFSALAQHNQDPTTGEDERFVIDVITGASAGGMSATVAAQKLLFDAEALAGAYQNSLYRAWVQDVTLDGLLALQAGEDPTHSILSSNLVESIGSKYLTARYQPSASVPIQAHPASAATIRLGLALSNLNGVNYSQPTWPEGKFSYTRYQDELRATIDGTPHCDRIDLWEPLRDAAVSCGAFPFAFRTKELVRSASEYPSSDPSSFPAALEHFIYTDGGVFQNEPLGLAKNLVDEIDEHLDVDSRFYLFVSPGVRQPSADPGLREAQANFKRTGEALAKAIFQQARFHDWVTAESVNARVQLFNERALGLLECILHQQISVDALKATSASILDLFYPPTDEDATEECNKAKERLAKQFDSEHKRLEQAAGPETAGIWIQAILAFETAAELGIRDEMRICTVTADSSELASSGVMAFVGFFDQSYRDHDYDRGRQKAQQFLADPNSGLGPVRFTPGAIRPIDPALDNLPLRNVPRVLRQQLKDRLRDRARDILKELGVPTVVVRAVIDLWLISPQLNKLLEL